MWSEHCSYKSSKVHLRQFATKAPKSEALLVGMGENAGVVDIGDGWAATFKIESHNHPSYVEPHQGAATGVGGIVRDIMSMGARPIAVMDALRFGGADQDDTRRVLPGVVEGISHYGNCLGLPNIGGEVVFDPCYIGNPLVNALCVGLLRKDQIKLAIAPGPGNKVVLFGASTGPDGIGGACVLASATFEDESHAKRPAVQVGDPFMEKLLIECCLELYAADVVVGIQDLGAAGVSCATTELAAKGTGGMHVDLNLVPLRDPSLQARGDPDERVAGADDGRRHGPPTSRRSWRSASKWDVPATVIGEVTDTGRLVMTWDGETIVDIPPGTAADEGPVYERPFHEPAGQAALNADTPDRLRPARGPARHPAAAARLAQPGVEGVGDLPVRPLRPLQHRARPARRRRDAAHLRGHRRAPSRRPGASRWPPTATAATRKLDPYAGAQLALAEAYRNVAVTGAKPLAVTNCLNFGSPEDPEVMWQFAEAVRGLADACQTLGVPVTGGNVSFYNQTGSTPIHPTPVVGVLGVIDDVAKRVPTGFTAEGLRVALLGETQRGVRRLGVGARRPRPPRRPAAAGRPGGRAGARRPCWSRRPAAGLLEGSHDLSDGGLAIALAESCLARGRRRDRGAERRRRSPTCSASRRRGRWSRSGRRPSTSSPRSASDHEVPCYGLGVTGGTRWWWRTCWRCRSRSCARRTRARCPRCSADRRHRGPVRLVPALGRSGLLQADDVDGAACRCVWPCSLDA